MKLVRIVALCALIFTAPRVRANSPCTLGYAAMSPDGPDAGN